jgi:hypothetical protein
MSVFFIMLLWVGGGRLGRQAGFLIQVNVSFMEIGN